MSLMLRKACEPLLENVGLGNFHVEIDHSTKILKIVGECGESIALVKGITFSRLNPTTAEIDYTTELLEAFLVKYAKEIQDLVQALQEVNQNKTNQEDTPEEIFLSHTTSLRGKVGIHQGNVTFIINEKGNITDINIRESLTLDEANALNVDYRLYVKACDLLEDEMTYRASVNKLERAKQALSVCHI